MQSRTHLAVAVLAALTLVVAASPAKAAVTIGQLAPAPPPANACGGDPLDILQPTVTSGNSYVVPATGGSTQWMLTSWSHLAGTASMGMLTLKVFRKIGEPRGYLVVGADGPRPLSVGVLNTFTTSIPVRAGDVLGLNSSAETGCAFDVPEDILFREGNLAVGASGDFEVDSPFRLNATALLTASNTFTLGKTTRNKKKGTATVQGTFPNPGQVTVSGPGVKPARARTAVSVPAGLAQLTIRAQGKKKKKLKAKGKAKVTPTITYTPAGGDARARSLTVKLRKKRKRKR